MDNYEIYHHGVKGQKWGVRRYQNKDGSLTARGKKRLGIGDSISGYLKKRKAESVKKKAAAEKAKAAEAKKQADEKAAAEKAKAEQDVATRKAEVLKTRSAKALFDNADLFTTEELRAAKLRLELERDISKMEDDRITSGQRFAMNAAKRAETVSSVVSSGGKVWNSLASVYNSLWGNEHGMSVPTISDKALSKAEKIKNEAARLNAESDLRDAKKRHANVKSELDKMKEETEKLRVKSDYEDQVRRASDIQKETNDTNDQYKNLLAKNLLKAQQDAAAKREAERSMPDDPGSLDSVGGKFVRTSGVSGRSADATKAYSSAKGYKETPWSEASTSSGESYVSRLLGGSSGSSNNKTSDSASSNSSSNSSSNESYNTTWLGREKTSSSNGASKASLDKPVITLDSSEWKDVTDSGKSYLDRLLGG